MKGDREEGKKEKEGKRIGTETEILVLGREKHREGQEEEEERQIWTETERIVRHRKKMKGDVKGQKQRGEEEQTKRVEEGRQKEETVCQMETGQRGEEGRPTGTETERRARANK
jgi:hypothetical protein